MSGIGGRIGIPIFALCDLSRGRGRNTLTCHTCETITERIRYLTFFGLDFIWGFYSALHRNQITITQKLKPHFSINNGIQLKI